MRAYNGVPNFRYMNALYTYTIKLLIRIHSCARACSLCGYNIFFLCVCDDDDDGGDGGAIIVKLGKYCSPSWNRFGFWKLICERDYVIEKLFDM